jgi:hypothetical protein
MALSNSSVKEHDGLVDGRDTLHSLNDLLMLSLHAFMVASPSENELDILED